jgi:hypothetical protein
VTVLDGDAPPRTTLIRERHHPVARLRSQVEAAGLELVAACGQRQGIRVSETVDEERDDKALLFARRRPGALPNRRATGEGPFS